MTRVDAGRSWRRLSKVAARIALVGVAVVSTLSPVFAEGATLKLGDILVAEPGTSSISVIDPATGERTVISQGGLLDPPHRTVGVALALDGDVIAVHRDIGLIRINPVTGAQTILTEGGLLRDPWAIAIDQNTGAIYVADSGYDNDRPSVNEAGKIVRVDPVTGEQELIAAGNPCTVFPSGAACLNTTTPGSYLAHPYGIAIDYVNEPGTLIVADMSSFNGQGAIIRIQPTPGGAQTLLWGPQSAVPQPVVGRESPLGCPMGVAVEPTGNILVTVFTFPVPSVPTFPPPSGTYYGCAPAGIYRIDLVNGTQSVLNANAPPWQPNHAYSLGAVVRSSASGHLHRVTTAGTSQSSAPAWNTTPGGVTLDGSVVWQNIGPASNWLIPFGLDAEPAGGTGGSNYNIIVGDEGHSSVFRVGVDGELVVSANPVASGIHSVTSVDVITFTPIGGFKFEPARSIGQPSGVLPAGSTQATLSLITDVAATCRYGQVAGTAYSDLPNTFSTTGMTTHSTTVSGLASGASYTFYVRCATPTGQVNTTDFAIHFVVAAPALQGPVAAYGFEESGGLAVVDASGNGNVGEISGAVRTAQGRFGKALSFDGIDDWVTVDHGPLLNLTTGMTLSAWVYPTSATGVRDVIVKEGGDVDIYNLYARNFSGTPEANVHVGGSNHVAAGAVLAANTWTHLAGTFDGSVLRFYRNGVLVSTTNVAGAITISGGPLRIGGNSMWGEFFQGIIDEVRIYNRPLSAAEIQADMGTPVVGSVPDTVPPLRSGGQPSGTLSGLTTQATLALATDEQATCRYSTAPGVPYALMTGTFTVTASTSHSRTITGLTAGSSYAFYVRCVDGQNNVNTDDYVISFAVGTLTSASSEFLGTESPLDEGGRWVSPGTWGDLSKSGGAFASVMNAQAMLVSPAIGPDQFSEVTFDQDPGSNSWVGVTTRIQGPQDGSGYLAIAYAGEVRLYRADEAGGLNFTLLASAPANIGALPRSLRLESQGTVHRVFFNGTQLIAHSDGMYQSGQPGIAGSTFGGPQVRILSFEGGDLGTPDVTAPFRLNGSPSGMLPAGTTQATLSLMTNENATCRYGTVVGTPYSSLTGTFAVTGGTNHSTALAPLSPGAHTYYIRCIDDANNANATDYIVSFTVASATTVTSTFPGNESVLSENGLWESPGAWANLAKSNGAFTADLNAGARIVAPLVSSDQFAEITYEQDPGDLSWVGVMTRVQGSSDGSGYLAIVYAGEVRLYRSDDSGWLNFTLLASASVNPGAAPRQIRLESRGNNHRVFFNGVQVIDHNAGGPAYSGGQPGIAASVFGGPQVRILSFTGGDVTTP